MIGLRNRIVHGYHQISDERLYETVSTWVIYFDLARVFPL
ncbi:MAG: DUF86 domain-containing protein [Thermoanaerobacterales bacterium]|nr:DUF86 domain-containing protein [Thermoanaerobacterales bacterium]